MSYKKNASSNRDALFGGAGGGGSSSKPSKSKKSSTPSLSTTRATSTSTSTSHTKDSSGTNRGYQPKKRATKPTISPELKAIKLKEAEDFKQKANKCMERGFFKSADPVAASTYFKRAADCYKQAGEIRLECLYRVEAGNCNFTMGAWASAAGDYERAAVLTMELVLTAAADDGGDGDDSSNEQQLRQAGEYYKKASEAWLQMGEKAKAAGMQVQAATALLRGSGQTLLSKEALASLEEAVEAHVPDVLNPFGRYRQTGQSAFVEPGESVEQPSPEALELAQSHIVTRSYAHEPLQQVAVLLVQHGEYLSALYAAGAATAILERDGVSSLTLSRAYCTETILLLAAGDPVAAEEQFLTRHVQKTAYLSSRECKLSEDLFRAIKTRDAEALEEVRSPTGSNRAALANLDEALRVLVSELRLSGVARKKLPGEKEPKTESKKKKASGKSSKPQQPLAEPDKPLNEVLKQKTGYEQDAEEGANLDGNALDAELDALNFGDSGGDDDSVGSDDFDLR